MCVYIFLYSSYNTNSSGISLNDCSRGISKVTFLLNNHADLVPHISSALKAHMFLELDS